jgi:hypothetical protein
LADSFRWRLNAVNFTGDRAVACPQPLSTDEAGAMASFDLVREAVSAVRQNRSDLRDSAWKVGGNC